MHLRFARVLPRVAAVATALLGILVLAGWAFAIPSLRSVLPGAVEMKANTALALIVSSIALFVLNKWHARWQLRVAQALAAAVCLLGLATFAEYVFGWQLHIDELLFRDTGNAYNAIRGRMSPLSALAFASIGIAMVAVPIRALQPLTWFGAACVTSIGSVSLLGYLWNAAELVTDVWLPPVALHSALGFVLLGIGTLLSMRDFMVSSPRAGGLQRVELKILAGFVAALLLLCVGGGFTYRAWVQFADAAQWVSHTQEVRATLGLLYGRVVDAESVQRIYVLTGDRRFVDASARHIARAQVEQNKLERLVADRASQREHFAQLKQLIARRFEGLARGIRLYESEGFDAVSKLIGSGIGVQRMEEIAALSERMDKEEEMLLHQREAKLKGTRQLTLLSLLFTLVTAAGCLTVLFLSIRQEMLAREKGDQQLREAKQAAESANRAKSTFLATMSHEIRTPMNGMFGMLELLSLTPLNQEQRTTLAVVRESGKSLQRIIDDILDFPKIEAGKLDIHPTVASIADVIDGVRGIYSGNASSKGLSIKTSTDARISPAHVFDSVRVRQILNNFVSNALKFTQEGFIELKTELVEQREGSEHVRLSVTDTGIGISKENQQRLFRAFVQAPATGTNAGVGTGLGLTICKRLASLMGGTIEMQSELGRGTTMTLALVLPLADPKELPSQALAEVANDPLEAAIGLRRKAPSIAEAEAQGTLILVVDDHPTNLRLLCRQVNTLGYAAESAENGLIALSMWRSGRFSLVLTDCNMPVMDGQELTRNIRNSERDSGLKRTPIIACTANAVAGEAERCLACGMDDYISKPVRLADLLRKLDQWLAAEHTPPHERLVSGTDIQQSNADVACPIDRSVLADACGGDPVEERETLADFQRVNRNDGPRLRHAIELRDISEVVRLSHKMKGASRLIGARELARVCEQLEQAGRSNDISAITADTQSLNSALARLNRFFDNATTVPSTARADTQEES